MAAVHDEGVCVRQWDWSETSQTVSIFCRDHGMVRGLAKGSRRPRSPYSGGIDLLTRGVVGIINRPSSELALVTEWDLQETFSHLRRSLGAFNAAMYAAELVMHVVRDHDPHPALYESLLDVLRDVETQAAIPGAVLRFQWATLAETGYTPVLDADARTRAPLPPSPSLAFSPQLGGLVADAGDPGSGQTWRVRATTVDVLRLTAAAADLSSSSPAALARANRLLAVYLRHLLGREPRTARAVLGRLPS